MVYNGALGGGWEHSYDRRFVATGGGSLALREGNGRLDEYSFDGVGFTAPPGRYTELVSDGTGIVLTHRHGVVETYLPLDNGAAPGALRSIADRNGNTLLFTYDGAGRLQTVSDTAGRDITYGYDDQDRIVAVTDYNSRAVTLAYDGNGDLVSITRPAVTGTEHGNDFPLGTTTRFAYSSGEQDLRLNHNLTAIISPNEVADGSLTPRTINTYGSEGLAFDRVVQQSWGGGRHNISTGSPAGGEVALACSTAIEPDGPAGAASKTSITDRGGKLLELWDDGAGHRLRDRQIVDGRPLITDYVYNPDGQMISITYPEGNRSQYTYDEGNPDRLAQGSLLETRRLTDGTRGCDGLGGTPCPDLVTTSTYELDFQSPVATTDPNGHTTTYSYDGNGNLTRVDFPDVTMGSVAPHAFHASWTYNEFGQPTTFTDPEGHVTRYEYSDDPSNPCLSNVVRDSGGLELTTEYEVDPVDNVTAITDPRGGRTEFQVNALNQVVKVTRDAAPPPLPYETLGYETLYWYDANGNLVRVDEENVRPELGAYFHPTGQHIRDPRNPWFTSFFAYDLLDNLVRQTREVSPDSNVVTGYQYDAMENLIGVTQPEGNRIEFVLDGRNRVRQITLGAHTVQESTTTYEYDRNGNLLVSRDGRENPWDYVYDGFDRRVGSIDPPGNIHTWQPDANSNLLSTTILDGQEGRNPSRRLDAPGALLLNETRYTSDERNRRIMTERRFSVADLATGVTTVISTDGDGDGWVRTARSYDRNGNLLSITDDNSGRMVHTYDGLDRRVLSSDALGNEAAYSYDGNGNLVQITATDVQPDGLVGNEVYTSVYTFDALDRPVQETDSLGQTTRFGYDSQGNLVFASDANGMPVDGSNEHGNTVHFAYDGLGRMVSSTTHLREGGSGGGPIDSIITASYAYDDNDSLISYRDANLHITVYSYDPLNRLTGVVYPSESVELYRYDAAHNLVEQTDPRGILMRYRYDGLNQLLRTEVTPGAGVAGATRQTYEWDGLSRLVAATDNNNPSDPSDDSSVAITYDSLSNWLTETQVDGDGSAPGSTTVVTSTYDGVGNRLSLSYPGGDRFTMTYDRLSRLKSITEIGGGLPPDPDLVIASFDYIGPWRILHRGYANHTATTYSTDGARRLTEVAHRQSGSDSLLSSFAYTFDRVGNILTEVAQPGDRLTTYTYDSLYRLVEAEAPDFSQSFIYDAVGNRLQETRNGRSSSYVTNEMDSYTAIFPWWRSHDANGNLVQEVLVQATSLVVPRAYLPLLAQDNTPLVQSASAVAPASPEMQGRAIVTETVISYVYDFADRLLEVTKGITVTLDGHSESSKERVSFTYDALGREISKQTDGATLNYLYAGGQLIETRNESGALISRAVPGLLLDRGGRRLFFQADGLGNVRRLADGAGTVLLQQDYEPFGQPLYVSGDDSVQPLFIFRGHRFDAASGLYVDSQDRYDPSTGRTLQRSRPLPGNGYTFAGNSPAGGMLR